MTPHQPRVVIVGGGFAGMAAARALANAPVDVLLIDRRNHSLFQPLLYQVATSALSPAEVAQPIRHVLRSARNITVHWDEVTAVDSSARAVVTLAGRRFDYDFLVLATGATHSYFGQDDWAEHAPGLKTLEDALRLRHRILSVFERAEAETDKARRDAMLEFVIVGGGPTGVEMAGAIAELARHSLARDFRTVTPHCAKIKLVEAGPRILAGFDEKLSKAAQKALAAMGVEVLTNARVTHIGPGVVELADRSLPAGAAIWAAGVMASPAAGWLGAPGDRSGRAAVDEHLRAPGDPRVFIVGDTASFTPKGTDRPLPGLAPVAKQMGRHAGRVIAAAVRGAREPAPFRYRDWGTLATIGRNKAVADFRWLRLTGFPAWMIWSLAHVAYLDGFANRVIVSVNWAWSYVTWRRGARLIHASAGAEHAVNRE